MYGDVIRVKIMYNKKDKALIQFADGKQAQLGTNTMMYFMVDQLGGANAVICN